LNDLTTTIEGLPRLIERAANALASATTAAEVLDAKEFADVSYTAAKLAERLARAKGAHDTVVGACRKAMADSIVIEKQAECRLADEYDAAQQRGDVQPGGRPKTIPNENSIPSVKDVGLSSKQVHEARVVRNAERKKPGIVRETVEAKLKEGKTPTRADVRKAVNDTDKPVGTPPKPAPKKAAPPITRPAAQEDRKLTAVDHARAIVRPMVLSGEAIDYNKLDVLHGISHVTFEKATFAERCRLEAFDEVGIAYDKLSPTAQQKIDALADVTRASLAATFEKRVRDEIDARLAKRDVADLERIAQANAVLSHQAKKPFSAAEFTKVLLWALGPTSNEENRHEAFKLVNTRKFLLREDGRIQPLSSLAKPLPKTPEDWVAAKAAAAAERKGKRAGVAR
jgi:hypothetical protein